MAPEVEGSNPFTHPIISSYQAPVAQLDRVADFESASRRFESYRARHIPLEKSSGYLFGFVRRQQEFWSDEKLALVPREARLTFARLWTCSDDYGITKWPRPGSRREPVGCVSAA